LRKTREQKQYQEIGTHNDYLQWPIYRGSPRSRFIREFVVTLLCKE
jgi:hypothetical protein